MVLYQGNFKFFVSETGGYVQVGRRVNTLEPTPLEIELKELPDLCNGILRVLRHQADRNLLRAKELTTASEAVSGLVKALKGDKP